MTGALVAEGTCEAGFADIAGQAGCAVSSASESVLETMFNWLVGGATWAVKWTGEAWLTFPEPTIGTADGTPSENISQLWSLGSFYIVGIAVIGFLIGVGRLMMSPSMHSGTALLRGIVAIIAVQSLSVGATVLLLDAGNQFSVWVVERASGKEFATALADFSGLGGVSKHMMAAGAMSNLQSVVAFAALGFLVLLLAAGAQVCLLIVRSALLVILMVFLPFLAAASFSEGGYKALSKGIGWMVALILYKPVAGIIYAVGVLTLKNAAEDATPEQQMMNLLIGVVVVAAAALALPALVKFVAPQAAAGASMAFSGGAAVAGAIGTGAAVVGLGATVGGGGAAAASRAGTTTSSVGGPSSVEKSAPSPSTGTSSGGGPSGSIATAPTTTTGAPTSGNGESLAGTTAGSGTQTDTGSGGSTAKTGGHGGGRQDATGPGPGAPARNEGTIAGSRSSSTGREAERAMAVDAVPATGAPHDPAPPAPTGASPSRGSKPVRDTASAVAGAAASAQHGAKNVDFNEESK